MIAEGTVIDGRYHVLGKLGAGGMADVYCAEDTHLGRKVALKLLHARFAQDQEFVERFRREASSAAGLQHPNVVGVYDRGEFDGTYYIAMEYCEGRTLKDIVARTALDPARAIAITKQMLVATRFAHRRNVIHRDLKPHNVILDSEDNVKVTDFGIARAGASDITEVGAIMGTAQYLSPEQAQGRPVTEASDLYSIGVVLFEMLTGKAPFDGDSAVAVALKHVNQPAPSPREMVPAVPPELEAVVLKALAKDPAQRYGDADSFIKDLEVVEERLRQGPVDVESTAVFAPMAATTAPTALAPVPAAAAEPPAVRTPEVEPAASSSTGVGEPPDGRPDAQPPPLARGCAARRAGRARPARVPAVRVRGQGHGARRLSGRPWSRPASGSIAPASTSRSSAARTRRRETSCSSSRPTRARRWTRDRSSRCSCRTGPARSGSRTSSASRRRMRGGGCGAPTCGRMSSARPRRRWRRGS